MMKSKMPLTTAIAIIVMLFIFLLSGCVSQGEYDRLEAELSTSKDQVAELQGEVAELQDEVETLKEEQVKIRSYAEIANDLMTSEDAGVWEPPGWRRASDGCRTGWITTIGLKVEKVHDDVLAYKWEYLLNTKPEDQYLVVDSVIDCCISRILEATGDGYYTPH